MAIPQAAGAAAAGGDISVVSVTHRGNIMTVTTRSGSQIASGSLTVHLFDTSQHAVLSMGNFKQSSAGSDGEEDWQAAVDVKRRGQHLDAGTYAATVDATDSSGTQNGISGGTFDFRIQTTITLLVTPSSISYDHRSVTFSGLANETLPASTTPRAYQNKKILIVGPPSPADPSGQFTAQTDASGLYRFSERVSPGSYSAEIPVSATIAGDESASVRVLATADPIRLSAGFARNPIAFGRKAAITGTLKYSSSGVMKRLPHAKVTVVRLLPHRGRRLTATTSSDGHYRVNIPRQFASGTWRITAGGTSLLGKAEVVRQLHVQLTTGFRHLYMRLGAFSMLKIRACLIVTSGRTARQPVNSPVSLQYSRRERGPWKGLATVSPVSGGSYCPNHGPALEATLITPYRDGYYRLRYAGNQSLRVSVSKIRHLTRDLTRITSFTITPLHVHVNGVITVSGRLWRRDRKGWHPYAGRKVSILFYYRGAPYVFDTEPKTSARGFFSGLFTAYVTAKWIARYNGDKAHFYSMSPPVKVKVSGHGANSQLPPLGHGLHQGGRIP